MTKSMVVVAILGGLTLGARRGCVDAPHRVDSCQALECENDCGELGRQVGADGCEVCACNMAACPQIEACAADCTPSTDSNGCPSCSCPQPTTGCMQDSDCPADTVCDVTNYCDAPPGCADGGVCPAVCYGRCVTGSSDACLGAAWGPTGVCQGADDRPLPESCCEGQSNPCAGASLDASGTCVNPAGVVVAPQCCPAPPVCGDGSAELCLRPAALECPGPLVAAPYNNCTWCFDAQTCERQCFADSDCDPGTVCKPDMNDVCNSPTARCIRPGVMTCQAAEPTCSGVLCDLYCPYGNVLDENGCETCACNPEPQGCICTREYAPVCGKDGNTYSNACLADCANVEVAYRGECTAECSVSCLVADPVCGADGVTYSCGAADATCHGTTVAYEGPCRQTCEIECVRYEPVCGADGVTYSCGAADAACHNTTVAYEGECRETCEIQCLRYDPVCGADGVTYSCGAADAECHHTTVVHNGACDAPCSVDSDCPRGTVCYHRSSSAVSERPAPSGKCELPSYCEVASDCNGRISPACVGSWSCRANSCEFSCGQ